VFILKPVLLERASLKCDCFTLKDFSFARGIFLDEMGPVPFFYWPPIVLK